jgi:hypothetical protein
LQKSRITKWKGLTVEHGSIDVITDFANDFERKAALYLMKDKGHKMLGVGNNVREALGIPKPSSIRRVSRAPDFASVSPDDGLVISEVKAVITGSVDVPDALVQLNNAVDALVKRNLEGLVERVQIIAPKGATFKNGIIPKEGKLFDTKTGKFVIVTGRSDLIVELMEL